MAYTTTFGYSDSVATKLNLAIPTLSYNQDFSVRSEKADEVVLVNTTTPIDQPETLRFATQTIGNIYNGTQVAAENRSVSQRGIQLLSQLNDILRVVPEDGDGCCGVTAFDLPIGSHLVVKVPLNQYVTPDLVLQVVLRNVAMMFNGSVTSERLNELLRGALKPSSM